MNVGFIIPLNELTAGQNRFFRQMGKEFFDSFDNSEIIDAQLDVTVVAEKSGRYVGVDCDVAGKVVVACDRCMDDLEMPVAVEVRLSVKFGEEGVSEDVPDGDREVVFVPADEAELDLGQIIYDYVCTSMPIQRVHGPGKCNPEAVRHLAGAEVRTEADEDGNPFAALKDLFKTDN